MDNILITTDLDSSLLDENYQCTQALATLAKLKELGIPLILNSSKTLAEIHPLALSLELTSPIVAENGGVVAIPNTNQPIDLDDYDVQINGIPRDTILKHIHDLRNQHHYQFHGFADWTIEQICQKTQLSANDAELAQQRLVTEPILWSDTKERLAPFISAIAHQNMQLVRGGKFSCIKGTHSKSSGLETVIRYYQSLEPNKRWQSVAIGDSENDLPMLESADTAIVIPHQEGYRIQPNNIHTIYAKSLATNGWVEAVENFINSI